MRDQTSEGETDRTGQVHPSPTNHQLKLRCYSFHPSAYPLACANMSAEDRAKLDRLRKELEELQEKMSGKSGGAKVGGGGKGSARQTRSRGPVADVEQSAVSTRKRGRTVMSGESQSRGV